MVDRIALDVVDVKWTVTISVVVPVVAVDVVVIKFTVIIGVVVISVDVESSVEASGTTVIFCDASRYPFEHESVLAVIMNVPAVAKAFESMNA